VSNFIEDEKIPEQFKTLYLQMKPNLPRCAPIRMSALKDAKPWEAKTALKWLILIKEGPYAKLADLLKCMPADRWRLLAITAPDLEELTLRRQLEKDLRHLWADTMPSVLKASRHASKKIKEEADA